MENFILLNKISQSEKAIYYDSIYMTLQEIQWLLRGGGGGWVGEGRDEQARAQRF